MIARLHQKILLMVKKMCSCNTEGRYVNSEIRVEKHILMLSLRFCTVRESSISRNSGAEDLNIVGYDVMSLDY
jgi:hypothetical protein